VSKLSVSALQQLHPNIARPFFVLLHLCLLCFVHLTMTGLMDGDKHTPPQPLT
jgi:hypothetical protein